MKLYYYETESIHSYHLILGVVERCRIYARNDEEVMRMLNHLQDILVIVYTEDNGNVRIVYYYY